MIKRHYISYGMIIFLTYVNNQLSKHSFDLIKETLQLMGNGFKLEV